MRRVFHPCCHRYSAPDGVLDDSDLESYLARVASRESPLALKQKRYDAILSIDCTAEGAAFVRLRTARAPRLYTDYLSLLKIDGRWQIVAKTFGWVPLRSEEHTSELQSLMRISYAVFCLKKQKQNL